MDANSPLKIKEDDILWRFYCKRFTLDGKPVESPKNHCRYFWAALKGFGFWLTREMSLKKLWGIFLLTNITAIGANFVISENFTKSHPHFLDTIVLTIVLTWTSSYLVAILATFNRIGNFIKRRPVLKRVLESIMLGGFAAVAIAVIIVGILKGEKSFADYLWEEATLVLKVLPYGLAGAILLILITFLTAKSNKKENKTVRLAKSFVIFLSDTKKKLCRTVEPPSSFKEKQKN